MMTALFAIIKMILVDEDMATREKKGRLASKKSTLIIMGLFHGPVLAQDVSVGTTPESQIWSQILLGWTYGYFETCMILVGDK